MQICCTHYLLSEHLRTRDAKYTKDTNRKIVQVSPVYTPRDAYLLSLLYALALHRFLATDKDVTIDLHSTLHMQREISASMERFCIP